MPVAIRTALPLAFIALVLALVPFAFLVHVAHVPLMRSIGLRVAAALLPALAVMGVALVVALAWQLAARLALPRVPFLLLSLLVYALALPRHLGAGAWAQMQSLGSVALFLALVVDLLCASALLFARRLLRGRSNLAAALAAFGVISLFAVLRLLGISLGDALHAVLAPLALLGDSYPALLVIVAAQTLLWLVGLHGPALLAAVVTPVYLALQQENGAAFAQHRPLPHIVTTSLFLFIFPGGSGATLPLAGWLSFSRVRRLRLLARAALLPAIFNANEPLVMGLPIVLDPILAGPFLGVPILLATLTYLTVHAGWVARTAFYVPSSIPSPIAVYLATLDPRAVVLVGVNIALAFALYFPFVRAYERREAKR